MTHSTIPFSLMKVHLMVAVEGRLFRKWFSAAPNLSYDFIWDKADVYSQKVYGLSEAFGREASYHQLAILLSALRWNLLWLLLVSVGFEYESCPDLILWEKRTAVLQGYETTASNLGGWSLDKHHALNIQSGKLVHGNMKDVHNDRQANNNNLTQLLTNNSICLFCSCSGDIH